APDRPRSLLPQAVGEEYGVLRAATASLAADEPGDGKSGRCRESSDECRLQRAAGRRDARKMTLDRTEDYESRQGERDRNRQGARNAAQQKIWRKWKKTAGDIGAADRHGAFEFAARLRLLQAELEAHHEIDPAFRIAGNGGSHGFGQAGVKAVFAQDLP